jgi:hypothetical protein
VSVFGKITDNLIALPEYGKVTLEIPELSIAQETRPNVFGDYSFWVVMPDRDGRLTVRIHNEPPLFPNETLVYPIAVGTVAPESLPQPRTDTGFFADLGSKIGTGFGVGIVLLFAVGAFILYGYVGKK